MQCVFIGIGLQSASHSRHNSEGDNPQEILPDPLQEVTESLEGLNTGRTSVENSSSGEIVSTEPEPFERLPSPSSRGATPQPESRVVDTETVTEEGEAAAVEGTMADSAQEVQPEEVAPAQAPARESPPQQPEPEVEREPPIVFKDELDVSTGVDDDGGSDNDDFWSYLLPGYRSGDLSPWLSFGSSYYILYVVDPVGRVPTPQELPSSPENSPSPPLLSRSNSVTSIATVDTMRTSQGPPPPQFLLSPIPHSPQPTPSPVTRSQPSSPVGPKPAPPSRAYSLESISSFLRRLPRAPSSIRSISTFEFAPSTCSTTPPPRGEEFLDRPPSTDSPILLASPNGSLRGSHDSLVVYRPVPRYSHTDLGSPEPQSALLCYLGPARPYEPPVVYTSVVEQVGICSQLWLLSRLLCPGGEPPKPPPTYHQSTSTTSAVAPLTCMTTLVLLLLKSWLPYPAPAEFEGLASSVGNLLSPEEKEHLNELRAYVVEDEGSWALGENFSILFNRILHDPSVPDDARLHLVRLMAAAALKDDVILLLHQDRKDHTIMNYANKVESLPPIHQESLALFFCNMFEHLSPSEWLLYISEWQDGAQQTSNIRVTTKVAVNALLHQNQKVQEYGTALMYNLGTKEVKTVVFDDVAPELAMAILQYLNSHPPEELLWRTMTALCRFCYSSTEVPALIKMIGPPPSAFKGVSERIDNIIEEVDAKLSRVRDF
ncbi:hypothetical protein C7M84_006900 [Penaeus vannamei]|uniref:Uncharacterized protein n=1 Tax=Penaeus vannamei TaxID=6689 RepID=A0A423TDP7_PENVA|nr:hypothetical protein C7M84_006900 [Penaeus vannamei]